MIPPRTRRSFLKEAVRWAIAPIVLSAALSASPQRGGHMASGGHAAAPRMSAPPPRVASPPRVARPPAVPVQPRAQVPVISRPVPSHSAPHAVVTRLAVPRATAAPVFGSRTELRMDSFAASLNFRNRRRIFPRPPRFFEPVFYPVGGYGFGGFGYGLGFCSPYWGWSPGCFGAPFGADFLEPWYGPVEPDYIPAPPDSDRTGDQGEVLLYLKDGTIYVISGDYWLQDNKLHYLGSDGTDDSVDIDEVDLQTTVNVNAKRGVAFTLRPAPDPNSLQSPQGGAQGAPENSPGAQESNGPVH
jgi:hypothetical protein